MKRGESNMMDTESTVPSTDDTLLKKMYPNDLKLRQVQMVFRHGDRTPIVKWNPYEPTQETISKEEAKPDLKKILDWVCEDDYGKEQELITDISKESLNTRTCEAGDLTRLGKYQHQRIGAAMRSIYVDRLGFLPRDLDPSVLSLRSTDVKRTKQSMQNQLSTLYPRTSDQPLATEESYSGMPITIRRDPKEATLQSETLYIDHSCGRVRELMKEFSQSEYNKEFVKREREPLEKELSFYLSQKDEKGRNRSMTEDRSQDATAAWSQRRSECSRHSAQTDVWEVFNRLEKVVSNTWWMPYSRSAELAKLGIGRLVGEISTAMQDKVEGRSTTKLALYSGHDSTIAPLLGAFKITDGLHWPPYASNIRFELFEREKKEEPSHLVRILFNNRLVQLPACREQWVEGQLGEGEFCPLKRFNEIADELKPKNYAEECERKLPRGSS
ncbi:hypothetical protein PROFUN_01702 [Planoprotostelium fungivorum]|uniref:Uncharacterized protein n=1 Tax=Planoprotostelium fungivorum TaxID=1890364 RepID=A0A2P6MWF4_9EUKA|nr:hypothetical protein PROFUN_01702 [Planoprotostelium fungivorum]